MTVSLMGQVLISLEYQKQKMANVGIGLFNFIEKKVSSVVRGNSF